MKFKFRHANKIVGLFILVALGLLVVMVVFAGANKRWFIKKTYYTSFFTSAVGLKSGMSVNLRGFEIGRVKEVRLTNNNQVSLQFYIYDTYHDRIRPNSVLALPYGLFGVAGALEFYPGLAGGPPLPDGSFIPSAQTNEGKFLIRNGHVDKSENSDVIAEILNRLPDVLEILDATLLSVKNAMHGTGDDTLGTTFDNTKEITTTLITVLKNVDKIAESLVVLASTLEDPVGLIPELMDPLLNDDNVLWSSIIRIFGEVENSVVGLRELSTSLADMSPEMALSLRELIRTLEDAQKVMEGLQNNPLIRDGITLEATLENSGGIRWEENF